jgi:hypothetical protein
VWSQILALTRYFLLLCSLVLAFMAITSLDLTVVGSSHLVLHGLADETAHALFAWICIVTARSAGVAISAPEAILGALMIDLDHVPLLLHLAQPPDGSTRPFSHSLSSVAVLLGITVIDVRRRQFWGSVALGVGSHLFRDLARGHVLLWWPLSSHPVGISYESYALVTGTLILTVALRGFPLTKSRRNEHTAGYGMATEGLQPDVPGR